MNHQGLDKVCSGGALPFITDRMSLIQYDSEVPIRKAARQLIGVTTWPSLNGRRPG
jgi:hypothetical protein